MKISKNGFTLSEVLIVLGLLGILAAILLPAVAHLRPNKEKMMYRKAYYIAERMVYEIVNDETLYPGADPSNDGLKDTSKITYNNIEYYGLDKFCRLFAAKVNTSTEISSTWTCNGGAEFATTDGLKWTLPYSNFSTAQVIKVKVPSKSADKEFEITVEPNGKMYPSGSTANIARGYLENGLNLQN